MSYARIARDFHDPKRSRYRCNGLTDKCAVIGAQCGIDVGRNIFLALKVINGIVTRRLKMRSSHFALSLDFGSLTVTSYPLDALSSDREHCNYFF